MTTFTVQMDQVEFIVGEMNAISRRIQQTLATLDEEARVNLGEWSSSARETYELTKKKWDAAAADMVAKSQQATVMLGTINEHYSGGERQGVSLWEH
ncbi:WXG100 family type VII secretion target [Streptomyces sp. NBC_01525]|uniref:WXG100 family type VII secretion target n=1 Tax=Streptomyces sp. NBC_01525 TaxID=2903893 RepID=UPI003864AC1D